MKTVVENVAADAEAIMVDLRALMAVSSIKICGQRYIGSFTAISVNGNNEWRELAPEGRKIQGKVFGQYRRFCDLIAVLLANHMDAVRSENEAAIATVMPFIKQDDFTHVSNAAELWPDVESAIRKQVQLVQLLYSGTDKPIFIPDTNAIYHNLNIEDWGSLHPAGFTICLVPTVVSEMDRHKTEHRVESVRKKAETFIRKLAEYRRRGRILDGVTLAGKLRVMAVAIEPRGPGFDWLDLNHPDDRIIASTLEIMRANVGAPVVIVTRDGGMHNKCELGGIPCVEPPDPPVAPTPGTPP